MTNLTFTEVSNITNHSHSTKSLRRQEQKGRHVSDVHGGTSWCYRAPHPCPAILRRLSHRGECSTRNSDRYTVDVADVAVPHYRSGPVAPCRHETLCHSFGCTFRCPNVLKRSRAEQPIRVVIWTAVLDHDKPHISFCRSGMNNQKKAAFVRPEHTVLLVPTLNFAHGQASGIVLGAVWQVRSAAAVACHFNCSMIRAFADAAAQV
jgi:hypothetical protein